MYRAAEQGLEMKSYFYLFPSRLGIYFGGSKKLL